MSARCLILTVGLGLAGGAFPGCAHTARKEPANAGALANGGNHSGDASMGGIRRVVMLPIWVGVGTQPEAAAALDPVFVAALQKEKRFEVVMLSRDECRRLYRTDALCSAAELPADLFSLLQRDFAADAVLFVDITSYGAYQPLTLGLRAKLAAIDDPRLIWTFDNLFASDPQIAAGPARNAFWDRDRSGPLDITRAAAHSPSKFAALAATSMFATLPPVVVQGRAIAK